MRTTPMKTLAVLAAIALIHPLPALAGGPVIVTEEAPIADVRPQGDGGNWVVPVVLGVVILCAIACGGSDDAPIAPPGPTCNTGC